MLTRQSEDGAENNSKHWKETIDISLVFPNEWLCR
jgi:hypothetical protein